MQSNAEATVETISLGEKLIPSAVALFQSPEDCRIIFGNVKDVRPAVLFLHLLETAVISAFPHKPDADSHRGIWHQKEHWSEDRRLSAVGTDISYRWLCEQFETLI